MSLFSFIKNRFLKTYRLKSDNEKQPQVEYTHSVHQKIKSNAYLYQHPRFTPNDIMEIRSDEIFVFESNLTGFHENGSAKAAFDKFGAIWGQGVGLQGRSYAIPTMQGDVETIKPYVDEFIDFIKEHPEKIFYITRIGCGIAGFKDEEIAPLFKGVLGLRNVLLPESFFRIIADLSIPKDYKIMEYGQVRTLADIIKALNDEHHYCSLETLMQDFTDVMKQYIEYGTINISLYKEIIHSFNFYESELFNKGLLDIAVLDKIISDENGLNDNEALYRAISIRGRAKLCRIIQYLNDFRRYNSSDELMDDLKLLYGDLASCDTEHRFDDSFHYPLFFFKRGIVNLWDKITSNGTLNNDLLEKYIFKDHEEKVNKFGLDKVIDMDYISDSHCHSEVYVPSEVGTGPVYVRKRGKYIKSCGEGKGPNAYPEQYEFSLIEPILRTDPNYEYINNTYIPKTDYSLPVYDFTGILDFKNESEKRNIIDAIRNKNRSSC